MDSPPPWHVALRTKPSSDSSVQELEKCPALLASEGVSQPGAAMARLIMAKTVAATGRMEYCILKLVNWLVIVFMFMYYLY